MVLIDSRTRKGGGGGLRRGGGGGSGSSSNLAAMITVIGFGTAGIVLFVTVMIYYSSALKSSSSSGGGFGSKKNDKKYNRSYDKEHPHLDMTGENSEIYNVIAYDIIQTLNCRELLNETMVPGDEQFGYGDDVEGNIGDDFVSTSEMNRDNVAKQRQRIRRRRRRRMLLEEEEDVGYEDGRQGDTGNGGDFETDFRADDLLDPDMMEAEVNGKHLFCMAAMTSSILEDTEKVEPWKDRVRCDATRKTEQRELLELWSKAQAEMMDKQTIKKVLNLAVETEQKILDNTVNLWAPKYDSGIEYEINELNNAGELDVNQGGIRGMSTTLGEGKLFVDVGSGLGVTSMAVALLYPGTKIISIEALSPNWLYQNMNWICNEFGMSTTNNNNGIYGVGYRDRKSNDKQDNNLAVLLSGVGPDITIATRMMWRPEATTSGRGWTPRSEKTSQSIELGVKLQPWRKLMADSEIVTTNNSKDSDDNNAPVTVDVLNVDCEGCEYNLIPSLTPEEFESISIVMGGLHWGYIPDERKPSSKRGTETHSRLCIHENFARISKECCEFLDLPVVSNRANEVIYKHNDKNGGMQQFPPQPGTVDDVIDKTLCEDFDQWKTEKKLHGIKEDWGWFQMKATAE